MRQAELKSGNTKKVIWMDGKQAKQGDCVKLKGDERLWDVVQVYEVSKEKEDLNRWKPQGGVDGI